MALACVLKIVRTVGTAMKTRIRAGMTVHVISSVVLPWVCFGSGAPCPPPELDDREEQQGLDEDEDGRPEVDQNLEQEVDVSIEIRVVVEDRIRVCSVAHAVSATAARAVSAAVVSRRRREGKGMRVLFSGSRRGARGSQP